MTRILTYILVSTFSICAIAEELTLFSSTGNATAYIDLSDELTLYMWNGKPAAYLDGGSSGSFNVYGFNGKHIGWFEGGVVRDHHGNAVCATNEAMSSTNYEPYKSYKQYKPYKAYKEYAPYRPGYSNSWSSVQCNLFLYQGAAD